MSDEFSEVPDKMSGTVKKIISTPGPFFLLFGRSPRIPIDLMFELDPEEQQQTLAKYVDKWQSEMRDAYAIARKNAQKNSQGNKKLYDQKVSGSVLLPGDRLLPG